MDWYYYDENGEKNGPYSVPEIKDFVKRGIITRETTIENANGRSALAGTMKGFDFPPEPESEIEPEQYNVYEPERTFLPVRFEPLVQTVQVPPPSVYLFCTNCGNSVSEQAAACMSCGARPVGHKKFCRKCGAGLNSEQVVCIKCGVDVTSPISTQIGQAIRTLAQPQGSFISWLCDFSFQDIRAHRANLWICRGSYIWSWVILILLGISASIALVFTLFGIFAIPLVWVFVAYFIYCSRLRCERKIIELDWKVETTKAARIYIENNNTRNI